MIVLDTNVLSELMRPAPDGRVTGWVAARPAVSLFTTTITQAEILYGVALLPDGRRKQSLSEAVQGLFDEDFAGRVLPFDGAAAHAYAVVAAMRRQAGQPIAQLDAQIAAICRSRGAALATRNTDDFAGCGVDVVNPWAP
jgi:predicted nucleic acid-binding protein